MLRPAGWGNLQSSTCKEGHCSTVETKKKRGGQLPIVHSFMIEMMREDESLIWGEITIGSKKKLFGKKETAGCQQWNELRTRCADRGLTGCLAPSSSATVSSVWWICSQPVRGSYQKSVACQSGGRMVGRCVAQVDRDPVNHCDPQLIDLFGAEDLGWDGCIMRVGFSQKDIPALFFTWKCLTDSQTF